jgi:hypothetical protein
MKEEDQITENQQSISESEEEEVEAISDNSDDSKAGIKYPHLRGKFTPRISLEASEKYVKKAYELGGASNSFDVLMQAVSASSPKGGTFGNRTYTPQNFGFWKINKKAAEYSLTDLGKQLVNPDSPTARISALQTAFRNNALLLAIWDQFKGQRLPTDEFFPNAIVKSGVPEELKKEWADYFLKAGKFAEVVNADRLVRYAPIRSDERKEPEASSGILKVDLNAALVSPEVSGNPPPQVAPPPVLIDGLQEFLRGRKGNISRKTISGDREVLIFIPEDLTQKDVTKIRVLLKAVDSSLEGYMLDED